MAISLYIALKNIHGGAGVVIRGRRQAPAAASTLSMRKYLYYNDGYTVGSAYAEGCWVAVQCPDADDIRFLTATLGVPPSFIEDLGDADELPRIETDDGWLLAILRVPVPGEEEEAPLMTVPLGVMAKGARVATLCYHDSGMEEAIIRLSARRNVNIRNHLDLILRIADSSTDRYLRYLRHINSELEASERKLQRSIRNEDLLQLRRMQRTLVYFNMAVKGNQMMTERLGTLYQESDSLDAGLLEDVGIDLRQAFNTVNVYTEILGGTMDSYTSIISNNLNIIMKRMTGFSIALMIPTGIASFYGMNVVNHIENSGISFGLIVVLSILASCLAILWFRKIK